MDGSGRVPDPDPPVAALERLLAIADINTGQSRCAANLLGLVERQRLRRLRLLRPLVHQRPGPRRHAGGDRTDRP
jgi:hypothetical protein